MKVNEILCESVVAKPALESATFPIATAAVEKEPKGALRVERFKEACNVLVNAMKAGEIISTQVEEMKYSLSYFIRGAFDQISRKHTWGKGGSPDAPPDELMWLLNPDTARTIVAYAKKLDKMSPAIKAHPMWKDAKALCDEFGPLVEAMDWVKNNTVKASAKKAEAKAAKAAEEGEYQKKYTDHKDVKKVIAILKKVSSEVENDLYKDNLKYMKEKVATFQQSAEGGNSDYMKIFERDGFGKMIMQSLCQRVYPKGAKPREQHFELIPKWESRVDEMAKKDASDMVDKFVYKNSGKLSYIIFTKNNLSAVTLKNVTVRRGAVEAVLHLEFADKSEFIADSSVVLSFSVLGKPFYRYPTIFRNVKLPDGSKMGQPSEQRMDEVFAIAK